jgi:hypothetical protein
MNTALNKGVDVLQAFRNLPQKQQEVIATDLMWSLKGVYESMGRAVGTWTSADIMAVRPRWKTEKCEAFMRAYAMKLQDTIAEQGWEILRAFVSTYEAEFEAGGA